MARTTIFLSIITILLITPLLGIPTEEQSARQAGRIVENAAPDTDGKIKILLCYDMEGISGQNTITSIDFGNEGYDQARVLLTDDVNAVIGGLFSGGADSVHVVDGHGSFNPEPDVLLDKMDPRAEMLYREKKFSPYIDLVKEGVYDALVLVSMHSKTGGGGFGAHTVTFGMDWILNDTSISETELFAYSYGRAGVPVILASGDDKLAEQVSWMDWLEYVTVKYAKSADEAELRPVEEVRAELRKSAERAVKNIPESKAVRLALPIRVQLRATPPADLGAFEQIPGIDYRDQSVFFEAADFQEAYDGIRGFMGVAQTGYFGILWGLLFQDEAGREMFGAFKEKLFEQWTDVESGRNELPASAPAPEEKSKKRYFGST